jgi:hypothetical protein
MDATVQYTDNGTAFCCHRPCARWQPAPLTDRQGSKGKNPPDNKADFFDWCARRAVAFVAIPSSYTKPLRHKVHFKRKSAFEEVAL